MKFKTLDEVELAQKAVFVRVDLNSPLENGKIKKGPRIQEHIKTLLELAAKSAKVVVLAHQGRKGDNDFTSLKPHYKILKRELKKQNPNIKIKFVEDVCSTKAQKAIEKLPAGQILLLENTRFLDCETEYEKTKKCILIDNLEKYCDVFVLDALSVAHRAHASVVGFKKPIRVAGRVMEKELKALEKFNNPDRPVVLILGGAKPKDSIKILKNWIENKADYVLCGGLFANIVLVAASKLNMDVSKHIDEQGLKELKEIYQKYSQKIFLPLDGAIEENGQKKIIKLQPELNPQAILDIGPKTIKKYGQIIALAKSILVNGPMGVYEKKGFGLGTKNILKLVSQSKAFSLIGGGNTTDALEKFHLKQENFGYVSLSGKALIEYLTENTLVGIKYLNYED